MISSRLRVRYLLGAQRDLLIQADYYESHGQSANAEEFVQAVAKTVELLQINPRIGRVARTGTPDRPELRRITLSGPFSRWLIFYRVTPSAIRIHRILDGSRDLPGLYL